MHGSPSYLHQSSAHDASSSAPIDGDREVPRARSHFFLESRYREFYNGALYMKNTVLEVTMQMGSCHIYKYSHSVDREQAGEVQEEELGVARHGRAYRIARQPQFT